MNKTELARAMRAIIRQLLGMPEDCVRPANQAAPTWEAPYTTVNIVTIGATGHDDIKEKNEPEPSTDVHERIQGQRLCNASVQFYRQGAVDLAHGLKTLLSGTRACEFFKNAGLGFVSVSEVRDISLVTGAQWETRAQMDIEFHVIGYADAAIPTYRTFDIGIDMQPVQSSNQIDTEPDPD
jgi:hypothetical protein